MTKKEKLATEYLTLRKEFDGPDFKENITTNQMWYLTQNFRVIDLENKIAAVKCAIEDKAKRLEKEAYFATEDGKKLKEELEFERSILIKDRKNYVTNTEGLIKNMIQELVGEDWTCHINLGWNNVVLEIGLKNTNKERNFLFEFGHDFEIRYDNQPFGEDKRFTMNYGTLGLFDLNGDEYRKKYIFGMGTIANNSEFLNNIKTYLMILIDNCTKLEEKINKINDKLNNPFE